MAESRKDWTLIRIHAAVEAHQQAIADLMAQAETIKAIAEAIATALGAGHKLLAYGNGGSAADAQHLVTELVGCFGLERPALPAIALTANSSILTAVANDYSYDHVFVRQVEALGQPGDLAVGISTSGNSRNVVLATIRARELGLVTIGLTGKTGGELASIADYSLCVGKSTPHTQEAHITGIHIICEIVESWLFKGGEVKEGP